MDGGTHNSLSNLAVMEESAGRGADGIWASKAFSNGKTLLLGTLQIHHVMGDFLCLQLRKHPKVSPHIMLYLFDHQIPRV